MEDPTGGLWIYLIFLIIPLARILPRILRKYRHKNAGLEPEPAEKHHDSLFFTNKRMPEQPRFREELPQEPQPKPDKKNGWVGKDDFE
tara:strand:+ start:34 stop:297 length:264 start_codon:yes stop_codon:yes gene_type:complete